MLSMAGKVAIVTGAGSVGPGWGNGKATATLLARQGAALFLVDINQAAAEETRGIIEAEHGTCAVHCCDMTQSADVAAMVQACVARFGKLDVLVNNVGGSAPGDPVSMTEEVWDRQIDANLKTAFLGCKYAIPEMLKQGKGSPFAVRAKQGIRVNTVVPGLMHTPLVETRLAKTVGNNDLAALIEARHRAVPMGRMGDAWDVAHAVLFLASDEARYITATEIIVDGGLTAAMP